MELDNNLRYGFIPGCSLASYSPEYISKTIEFLNEKISKFSAVLKCCGKPTRDLGEYELFQERFFSLKQDIKDVQIDKVILACPNCKKVFEEEYGEKMISLWEVLPLIGLPEECIGKAKDSDVVFTIHDSCSARYDKETQDGVRWILSALGYQYVESSASRENTRCCGFGGMVNTTNSEMSAKAARRRVETLGDNPVVTYCSSCRSSIMQAGRDTWHILDLIWGPVIYSNSVAPVDVLEEPREVWHNRYRTKTEMKKILK